MAGVIVLLLNDHLFKQLWPGFLTGKLSDVAGLVVAPALVALLFRRRADLAAIALTGLLFTLVKTTETGAELASQAWGLVAGPSRVLADPTDLIALPALALAWWVRRRSATTDSRKWRIMVTVPLAVLAVTATSAAAEPRAAVSVEVTGTGKIVVHTAGDGSASRVSDDGGTTWTDGTFTYSGATSMGAQCVPGQATRCYRVRPDRLGVEQSDDGGRAWRPAWPPSPDAHERLTRTYDENEVGRLRSYDLAVQARPGGHVVIVANGVDGILIRDVSGVWRRLGWSDTLGTAPAADSASASDQVDLGPEQGIALFLAACMLLGAVGAGMRKYQGVYLASAAVGSLAMYAALDSGSRTVALVDLTAFFGWIVALVAGIVCLVLACDAKAKPVSAATGVVAAPLVYATVYTPFYGWSLGTPATYGTAVVLAIVLTSVIVLAGVTVIAVDARRHAYLAGSSTSSPT
ncbi:hypothetical protein ACFFV7_12615 [Nonomuraea spiralis]|uniref:Uncharacterized protein n=1 Tax=Nonomuraea spiralis TaxID=46182 RepID=A0ABV5IC61_9ACTN|nr:hypothetical protein [Nonomuraea spiralis]GGS79390.1 hypothetical protein GCM10010176_023360 [Nonomuraea spiralis]